MHPALACSILLSLHLHAGSHVTEHAAYDDRIAWVLPPDRLESFAKSGVVITEDKKTRIIGLATVAADPRGLITLNGTVNTTTEDVPRHRADHDIVSASATMTPRNDALPARRLDIEEAAMASLPVQRLCVGATWRTHVPVMTSLGSGVASIDHKVVGIAGHLIEIDVKGAGIITGVEYNLPHLLPGSLGISGKAWFDAADGLVTQESYIVRNRLIRTAHNKTIGFLETETVDVSTHVDNVKTAAAPDPRKTQ